MSFTESVRYFNQLLRKT